MHEHNVETSEQADAKTSDLLATALAAALDDKARVSLALSGGRTPPRVLRHLARVDLDWARVVITFTDERWVPVDHPDSNEGAARASAAQTPIASATFCGLYSDAYALETSVPAIEQRLRATCPMPIDVAFLGMGEDGHIASLFPNRPWQSDGAGKLVVTDATPAADAKHGRISLTAEVLQAAKVAVFVAAGAEKRAQLERARVERDALKLPVSLLVNAPKTLKVHCVCVAPNADPDSTGAIR